VSVEYLKTNPIGLIFTFFLHFIYYHELGHILQHTGSNISFNESLIFGLTNNESIKSHLKEFDADMFAGKCVGVRLVRYEALNRLNGQLNIEAFEALCSLVLAGIIIFFFKSSTANSEIYYEEKSHPHAFVRSLYTGSIFMSFVTQSSDELRGLDKYRIADNANLILEKMIELDSPGEWQNISKTIEAGSPDMLAYCEYLQEQSGIRSDITLANYFKAPNLRY
jgi:hypothetical protein